MPILFLFIYVTYVLSSLGIGQGHWAQLTKKLASLSAILIVKNLASLTLIRYFAIFC